MGVLRVVITVGPPRQRREMPRSCCRGRPAPSPAGGDQPAAAEQARELKGFQTGRVPLVESFSLPG